MSDLIFLGYRIPKIDFSIGDNFGSGPVQLDVNIKEVWRTNSTFKIKLAWVIRLFCLPLLVTKTTTTAFVPKSL